MDKVHVGMLGDSTVIESGGEIQVKTGGRIRLDGGVIQLGSSIPTALTTVSLAALTTVGVAALSTSQTQAMTTTQLSALCVNNDLAATAIPTLQADLNTIKSALQTAGFIR